MVELESVRVETPEDTNTIIGISHFIKTTEDLYEALIGGVPGIKFGLAFCEASGPRLIRTEGNDSELIDYATRNAERIAAGHSFIIHMRDAFPINVLNQVKMTQEVCNIVCATANPLEVIIAETEQGRGIIGVIDGEPPLGVESEENVEERRDFLRTINYKL